MMTNAQRQKWIDYDGFVEKFKPKKTTDDCYTPEAVYNAIRDWGCEEYGLDASKFVRPFYPGGDYEGYDYPEDCVVVDNPPFSILAQIISFYVGAGIKFFLFANNKTLFSVGKLPVCFIGGRCDITYENGAKVNTAFITNLEEPGVRTAPSLTQAVRAVNNVNKNEQPKYKYPDEVLTFSKIETLNNYGVNIKIPKNELFFIRQLDTQRQYNKKLFGAGFLMSEKVSEAIKLIMEEIAVKKTTIEWQLSEREREIVNGLG